MHSQNVNFGHCVKSVRIWSFSGLYFAAFGLNTERYGPEKLRIRTLFTQWVTIKKNRELQRAVSHLKEN